MLISFYTFPFVSFIEEEDLRRVMIKEEVDLVLPLFEVDETRRIDWKSLTNWVVSSRIYYFSFVCSVVEPPEHIKSRCRLGLC